MKKFLFSAKYPSMLRSSVEGEDRVAKLKDLFTRLCGEEQTTNYEWSSEDWKGVRLALSFTDKDIENSANWKEDLFTGDSSHLKVSVNERAATDVDGAIKALKSLFQAQGVHDTIHHTGTGITRYSVTIPFEEMEKQENWTTVQD